MVKKATIKTKYGPFHCVFEPEKDMGGYTAEARDVQGAVSWGKNLNEAKKMIAEAIEGIIEAEAVYQAQKSGLVRIINKKLPHFA
ncbi:MAG: hypothetical protein G01um101424_137 [Parcubacteria group bacterium Gr01-1014_24]|nr:MAG: hypothetical protein G01um101424_137 [Parcubacteria group bacterium Gr01-1014_24]